MTMRNRLRNGKNSNNYRSVFVTHTAVPGGGELALTRYLSQTKIRNVVLFAGADGPVWNPIRRSGVEVITSPSLLKNPIGAARFYWALRRQQSDQFVANTMRSALLASIILPRSARIVYWVRDGLTQGSVSAIGLFLTRIITLRRVNKCIANSKWTASSIRELAPGIPVEVCPSPSGIHPSKEVDAASDAPKENGVVRVLFLGRIAPWKGVHIAAEAIQLLNASCADGRTYTLDIAGASWFGEDAYMERIMVLANEGHNISYLGHVNDVQGMLSDYDCMVHCSLLPEPFGQVIVQGMAHGLVVIAANSGGPAEIITDGQDGFLVEPGNAKALAAKLVEVFDAPTAVETIRRRSRQTAQQYADTAIVERLDSILGEVSSVEASDEVR